MVLFALDVDPLEFPLLRGTLEAAAKSVSRLLSKSLLLVADRHVEVLGEG